MEAILATDINSGISKDGIIPWKSKKDMRFFFNKTKNNIVIMGRSTYFSLPEQYRPLKERLNIVLTRDPEQFIHLEEDNLFFTNDDKIYESILNNREKYFRLCPALSSNFIIFIIGGKQIYEKYISLCDKVWLTTIKKDYSCDLFFNYDYSELFKERIEDNDDELKIIEYNKKIN
jgi:dihydrofolate reductase